LGPRGMRMEIGEGSRMGNLIVSVHLIVVRVTNSRRLRWVGYVAIMEEGKSAFKMLTDKPTQKRFSGRPKCRWEDNIKMDLKVIGINKRNS
jgi:hypothetical protein